MIERYEDITFEMLGTHRQRPMYLSAFHKFRKNLGTETYPPDPHKFTQEFLERADFWIDNHKRVHYNGLSDFTRRDAILGTTHQIDELHMLHGKNIAVLKGEYKYHRRLTDFKVKQMFHNDPEQLVPGDVWVVSYPSCITTGLIDNMSDWLDHCERIGVPVHIDGAWYGQCRNFSFDVTHPAVQSVSVSLSKALGMGSQRIGIRYSRERVNGPIAIMNDFNYANVSDMWIGAHMMDHFGPDFWWGNYEHLYEKVCADFGLKESDSIHVGWHWDEGEYHQFGVRTPLRMLIDGIFDERGTNKGLNAVERADTKRR